MAASLNIGLIGAGYMGRAHAIALHGVGATFGAEYAVECAALAEQSPHSAQPAARALGFARAVSDWRELVHRRRVEPGGATPRSVENEDIAQALLEFASGVRGTMEISRIATGYKCGLALRLQETRGSIAFDQERMKRAAPVSHRRCSRGDVVSERSSPGPSIRITRRSVRLQATGSA